MRISCVQMDMRENRPEENRAHAEDLIRAASAADHPDLILLPETWNTGFAPASLDRAAADHDGAETKKLMSALAAELSVNIAAGSVTDCRDGRIYNTAYVFDRRGACVASYDKTHLFSPMGEDRVYEKGTRLARFTLDGVSCALITCYDVRFPELVRTLALPGLDLLLVVSQWPAVRAEHLAILTRARAIENQMFLALCNSCGTAAGTRYGGRSAILDPWGATLAEAGEAEAVLTADADMAQLQKIRGSIPVFADRRPALYQI